MAGSSFLLFADWQPFPCETSFGVQLENKLRRWNGVFKHPSIRCILTSYLDPLGTRPSIESGRIVSSHEKPNCRLQLKPQTFADLNLKHKTLPKLESFKPSHRKRSRPSLQGHPTLAPKPETSLNPGWAARLSPDPYANLCPVCPAPEPCAALPCPATAGLAAKRKNLLFHGNTPLKPKYSSPRSLHFERVTQKALETHRPL